jgi:hypothetical protein
MRLCYDLIVAFFQRPTGEVMRHLHARIFGLSFFQTCLWSIALCLLPGNNNLIAQSEGSDDSPESTRGEITLSIGDGFVFGETEVRPDEDRSSLDIYVQDIRYGVSLAALAGCTVPAQPMTSFGMPSEPLGLLDLLKDAPLNLPKRDVWLRSKCTVQDPGIGLVSSRAGKTYKLCLLEINGHPEALKRTVRIAYEVVPQKKNGGVLQLPKRAGQPDANMTASIRESIRIGALIPGGGSYARNMEGNFAAFSQTIDGYVPKSDAYIALTRELNESVKMMNRGAFFAGVGIGEHGSILLDAYGAIGVKGPMLGQIDLESYGYIYIDGPMQGTLNLDSYSTVVLRKGMAGKLNLRSYADILIQGPITGTIDANGSCWCTLYFDGKYSAKKLAAMSPAQGAGGDFHQITLHIRESDDLDAGEHENVGSWRKVIVGDPVWKTLK